MADRFPPCPGAKQAAVNVVRAYDEAERQAARRRARQRLNAFAPDLLAKLKFAVARVKLANAEGDMILSAWLPDAEALIAQAEGRVDG